MHSPLVSLAFAAVVCLAVVHATDCQCDCNNAPTLSTPVSSCSICNADLCRTTFPSVCPAVGTPGMIATVCVSAGDGSGGGGGGSSTGTSGWLGQWTGAPACAANSTCCCLSDPIVFSGAGANLTMTAGLINGTAGACGSQTSFTANCDGATSNTAMCLSSTGGPGFICALNGHFMQCQSAATGPCAQMLNLHNSASAVAMNMALLASLVFAALVMLLQ